MNYFEEDENNKNGQQIDALNNEINKIKSENDELKKENEQLKALFEEKSKILYEAKVKSNEMGCILDDLKNLK